MKIRPGGRRSRAALKREPTGSSAVMNRRYRYSLTRWWEGDTIAALRNRVVWVMLNPSTADAQDDDPTIGRVTSFSKAWGHTSFEVVNLFAYRATDPHHLWGRTCDIVGPQNNDYLRAAIGNANRVVVAWGAASDPRVEAQVSQLKAMCRPHGVRVWCLGTTQGGGPKHPLYLAADTEPVPFEEITSPLALQSYSPTWLNQSP